MFWIESSYMLQIRFFRVTLEHITPLSPAVVHDCLESHPQLLGFRPLIALPPVSSSLCCSVSSPAILLDLLLQHDHLLNPHSIYSWRREHCSFFLVENWRQVEQGKREWGEAEGESVKEGWRAWIGYHPAPHSDHTRSSLLFCFTFCDCGTFSQAEAMDLTWLHVWEYMPQYLR